MYRPETAQPMKELAEVLLRGESTLTRGERELIASVVSTHNECVFCSESHAAFAAAQTEGGMAVVAAARRDPATAPISAKLKSLLVIARQVQQSGRAVTDEAVANARAEGATDRELHDTVLIAAAFCMFNRYVDGLQALTPTDPQAYAAMADLVVKNGYVRPFPTGPSYG